MSKVIFVLVLILAHVPMENRGKYLLHKDILSRIEAHFKSEHRYVEQRVYVVILSTPKSPHSSSHGVKVENRTNHQPIPAESYATSYLKIRCAQLNSNQNKILHLSPAEERPATGKEPMLAFPNARSYRVFKIDGNTASTLNTPRDMKSLGITKLQRIRNQVSTPNEILSTCGREILRIKTAPNIVGKSLFNFCYESTELFIQTYFIEVVHGVNPEYSSIIKSHSYLSEPSSKRRRRTMSNKTVSLTEDDGIYEDSSFTEKNLPRFPCWSKICALDKWPKTAVLKDDYIIQSFFKNRLLREIVIFVLCIVYAAYQFYRRRLEKETKKADQQNIAHNSILNSMLSKLDFENYDNKHKKKRLESTREEFIKVPNFEFISHSKTAANILNGYIFRTWRRSSEPSHDRKCPASSEPNPCSSFDSSPCSECMQHLENVRYTNRRGSFIQVNPVTSFLPNPTRNPAIDFVHVSYRLATLSALPPSVPTSRIKMADAGFYFRGQGDEVTCYSCGISHSGWRREDSPMDIHQRLSPHCPHVVERLRETAAFIQTQGQRPVTSAVNQTQSGLTQASNSDSSASLQNGTQIPSHSSNTSRIHENGVSEHVQTITSPAAEETEHRNTDPSQGLQNTPGQEHGFSETTHNPNLPSLQTSSYSRDQENGDVVQSRPMNTSSSVPEQPSTHNYTPNRDSSTQVFNTAPEEDSEHSSRSHDNRGAHQSRTLFPRPGLDLGGAVYPMYQNMESRRRTFNQWDDRQAPPLDQVILCGMFYAGYADCVRCFYCGVGLKHWVAGDDVWTEHVRWRPGCGYLRAVKGDQFIRDTQTRLGIQPGNSGQTPIRRDNVWTQQGGSASAEGVIGVSTSAMPTSHGTPLTASITTTNSNNHTYRGSETATPHTTRTGSETHTTRPPSRASDNSPPSRPEPSETIQTSAEATTTTTATGASNGSSSESHSEATTTGAASAAASGTSPNNSQSLPAQPTTSMSTPTSATAAPTSASRTAESIQDGELERLTRLQAENRAMTERLRCRRCRSAPIDTILMPCGHLVLCENCARSVTSCPLCHDPIRATAKVHLA